MTYKELISELQKVGLRIVWNIDKKRASVASPHFANPLIWFEAYLDVEDYMGTVEVKSINVSLYTEEQIRRSLMIVNEFLLTPLKNRGL